MPATELVVLWRVFEHCNLGCSFCGYSARLSRPRAVVDVQRIEAFGKVLGNYRQAYRRPVLVSWLGGEPLLWPSLPGLSRNYKRRFGLQLSVTTNGIPLDSAEIRRSLVDDFDEVTISVDGLGPFHDACRNAPGLFDRLRTAVCTLRAEADAAGSGLCIKVNTVLMRGNIDAFELLCREVAGWGVRELTFNQLGGNDRPEFYPANRLLPEQVAQFADELPQVRERMARLGLVVHGTDRYLQRIASTARGERMPIDDCGPGLRFLFIDEQGRIGPCSFTTRQYGVPLEVIASAEDLCRLPAILAARRRLQRAAPCEDCHSTQVFDKFELDPK